MSFVLFGDLFDLNSRRQLKKWEDCEIHNLKICCSSEKNIEKDLHGNNSVFQETRTYPYTR
jgi:hypothetical protein